MFWSIISLSCGFISICKEFCMAKWMKFKLKLGFLVLARVKGKTSQQSLMTWLAFWRAATLCLPLMGVGDWLIQKGGGQGPKKTFTAEKNKSLRMSWNGEICNKKNRLQTRLQHRSGELSTINSPETMLKTRLQLQKNEKVLEFPETARF